MPIVALANSTHNWSYGSNQVGGVERKERLIWHKASATRTSTMQMIAANRDLLIYHRRFSKQPCVCGKEALSGVELVRLSGYSQGSLRSQ
jgi:hypothetical protein